MWLVATRVSRDPDRPVNPFTFSVSLASSTCVSAMLFLAQVVLFSNVEPDLRTLQTRLQAIAAANQAKYNCSIGIGLQSASTAMSAVAGQPSSSRFVWGSVTKQATGAAILQAVEENLISLDEPAYTHLDPMLASLGLGSLCELFGSDARLVTTRHLATMMSGIPDCARRLLNLHPAKLRCAGTLTIMVRRPCVADDTAKPFPPPPVDPFRAEVYRTPALEFPVRATQAVN